MKKVLLALTALALTATAASAQTATPAPATVQTGRHAGKGAKSPAQRADRQAAKMAKELSLNADQEAKAESILLARSQEMQALKTKYAGQGANRQAMRPEAKALRDKYDGQLRAALGPDAYARYDKMRDEHHAKMRAARGAKDGKAKLKLKS